MHSSLKTRKPDVIRFADQFEVDAESYRDVSIDNFPLLTRTKNCLYRNGIMTLGDLLHIDLETLLDFRSLGYSTLSDIKSTLLTEEVLYNITGTSNYIVSGAWVSSCRLSLTQIIGTLPEERKSQYAYPYLMAYAKEKALLLSDIIDKSIFISNLADLPNEGTDPVKLRELQNFAIWLSVDLRKLVASFFNNLFSKDYIWLVIENRASGKNLHEAGKAIGVSGERTRQIEQKALLRFSVWLNRNRIVQLISALKNGKSPLSPDDIIGAVGAYCDEFLYLLKKASSSQYSYSKSEDIFNLSYI